MDGAAAVQAGFFISRTGAGAEMARLIAGIVREAGRKAFYQDGDFGHAGFMRRMEQGYESGARMIALLPAEDQQPEYWALLNSEWASAITVSPAARQHATVLGSVKDKPPAAVRKIAHP